MLVHTIVCVIYCVYTVDCVFHYRMCIAAPVPSMESHQWRIIGGGEVAVSQGVCGDRPCFPLCNNWFMPKMLVILFLCKKKKKKKRKRKENCSVFPRFLKFAHFSFPLFVFKYLDSGRSENPHCVTHSFVDRCFQPSIWHYGLCHLGFFFKLKFVREDGAREDILIGSPSTGPGTEILYLRRPFPGMLSSILI